MDENSNNLLQKIAGLNEMSAADARQILQAIYSDGIVARVEAEALYRCNNLLDDLDPEWKARFIQVVVDYLVTNEAPQGWISDEEAEWLLGLVALDSEDPDLFDIDLVTAALRKSDGAPSSLAMTLMGALKSHIVTAGNIDAPTVERLRAAMFAPSGHAGLWVSRDEATFLFELNDLVAFESNDPSWNDFFARAVGNHLMAHAHPDPQSESDALAREAWLNDTSSSTGGFLARFAGSISKGGWFESVTWSAKKDARSRMQAHERQSEEASKITEGEQDWLQTRLGWDKTISPAERALIRFLKEEIPGFAEKLVDAA